MFRFALIILLTILPPAASVGATYIVDTGQDAVDLLPGDGVCATTGGECSLRAALTEADLSTGADTVIISLAVARVSLSLGTLSLAGNGTVLFSESGESEIDGLLNPSATSLLAIEGDSNHVYGVTIRRSRSSAILITGKYNAIGDSAGSAKTVLVENGLDGGQSAAIVIRGESAQYNVVRRCLIGVDRDGVTGRGNHHGVVVESGASENLIGGVDPTAWNIISGNDGTGVVFRSGASDNRLVGALIGLDAGGFESLPNGQGGVLIESGASNNIVGTADLFPTTYISGNAGDGVCMTDPGTSGNVIMGIVIGLDITANTSLGNQATGVRITGGATDNIIGGAVDGARNLIGGNWSDGVRIEGAGTDDNRISGNWVGVAANGFRARSNGLVDGHGVSIIDGPRRTVIGGTEPWETNVISGQINHGILISGSTTRNTSIIGNFIGVDTNGRYAFANGAGVVLRNGASYTTIGGASPAERNVIGGSYNQNYPFGGGVVLYDEGTSYNEVLGNHIGTDSSGANRAPNYSAGVIIGNGASNNWIGGRLPGEGNLISGNGFSPLIKNLARGIHIDGPTTTANVIQGNSIGPTAGGNGKLRNAGHGIGIFNGANENVIGGALPGESNLIAFNDYHGVYIAGSATARNTIRRNAIRQNDSSGVVIAEQAQELIEPPVILQARVYDNIVVSAGVNSGLVDVYRAAPDADGRGEPGEWLASGGLVNGTMVIAASGLQLGDTLTAIVTDTAGNSSACADNFVVSELTGIGDDQPDLPLVFALDPNYPNPFNPTTEISFSLPKASRVTLIVFNALGQQVAALVDGHYPAGSFVARWDGRADSGHPAASGVYFYRLSSDIGTLSRKMLLLK